ncbi:TIF3A1 [Symbiodinium sp. CCMP2456]|nr:TIF3A1 [Symbiodinium sp. CCMP2456]
MCKFGIHCARADCLYSHPEGRVAVGLEPKVCFFCGQDGHIATECPRNPESLTYDRQAAMRGLALQNGQIKAITAGRLF